jgi:hypothetical protein
MYRAGPRDAVATIDRLIELLDNHRSRPDARRQQLRACDHLTGCLTTERVFNPDRKHTHWGKRKLKRDQ